MKSKISKFLICSNPMVGEGQFIFCTRDPEMLLRVIDEGNELKFEVMEVYSGTQEDVENATKRAKDWYVALKLFNRTLK